MEILTLNIRALINYVALQLDMVKGLIMNTLYILCDSYTHIMDEDDVYVGFYIDSSGYTIMGKLRRKNHFEFN